MACKSKQLSLLPDQKQSRLKSFGGDLNQGRRKTARPISIKKPMHLVIKSTKAVGRLSFLNHQSHLDRSLRSTSKKWGVIIRKTAWVRNHVHLVLQFSSRTQYQVWIRELTAALVRAIAKRLKKANSTESLQLLKSFFDHRPFTRIIDWGRDYRQTLDYLILNQMEVIGLRPWKDKPEFALKSSLGEPKLEMQIGTKNSDDQFPLRSTKVELVRASGWLKSCHYL